MLKWDPPGSLPNSRAAQSDSSDPELQHLCQKATNLVKSFLLQAKTPFTDSHNNFDSTEVSASFKPDTSVVYTFAEPLELHGDGDAPSSSVSSDVMLRGENISLSFSTHQSPALLLYVDSFHREYLALLLNKHGQQTHRLLLYYFTSIAPAACLKLLVVVFALHSPFCTV